MVGRYRLFMNLGYEGISPEVCKKKKLKVNCLSSVKMDRIFDRVFMDNFVEKRNVIFLKKIEKAASWGCLLKGQHAFSVFIGKKKRIGKNGRQAFLFRFCRFNEKRARARRIRF